MNILISRAYYLIQEDILTLRKQNFQFMILVLSPAKTLNEQPSNIKKHTDLVFAKESLQLVKNLKKYTIDDLEKLMHISPKLAEMNQERYQSFRSDFSPEHAYQAIHMFKGDVYVGLDAQSFDDKDLHFAQKAVRILSGLYGLIKPLDLVQPYRLEMGTPLANGHGKNLYEFWEDKITKQLNQELADNKSTHLLNLASVEYFKSIDRSKLAKPVIDIDFKEDRDGRLKVISFTAKKARGDMARQVVKNRIKRPVDLMSLDVLGYKYIPEQSTESRYLFVK